MCRPWLLLALAACGHPTVKPQRAAAPPPPAARVAGNACADPQSDLAMPDGDVATIDAAGVVRALDGHRGELRRCYQRYLKRATRAGDVVATFAVRDDGTVSQVHVHGFAVPLDLCLCNVVARVQFPAPHATAIVSYPISFVF